MAYSMGFVGAASSTYSMPAFHSESPRASFEDAAPYPNIGRSHCTSYRPSSSGSGGPARPAPKRRGLGKMFGGVKKAFKRGSSKPDASAAISISEPTDILINGAPPNEANMYALGVRDSVRKQKSVRFSTSSTNKLHKAPPVVPCKGSGGFVTPTERRSMDAEELQSLDSIRGRTSCEYSSRSGLSRAGSFLSSVVGSPGISKAKSSKRSRASRAASTKRQNKAAEMAAQELLNQGFVMPEIGVTSPTTVRSSQYSRRASVHSFEEGDDESSFLVVAQKDVRSDADADAEANAWRPSSARASMGSLTSLYVANSFDADSICSISTVAEPVTKPVAEPAEGTCVYSVTNLADNGPTNADVLAALEGAFDIDFELQDVAASDALPAPTNGYGTFKARCAAERLVPSASAPSLGFLPSLPPLDLENDAAFMPAPLFSPSPPATHVIRNRDEALAALEGYDADLIPAALKPQQFPTCLMPGPRYTDAEGNVRASYTGFQTSNQGSSYPAEYVEGPDSYMAFRPQAQWEAKAHTQVQDSYAYAPQPRSQTPMTFPDTEQHKSHYARVESGLYDSPVEQRPANPSPPSTFSVIFSRYKRASASSSAEPKQPRTRLHKDPPSASRKPVPSSSAPAPAGPSSVNVPAYYKMNDNGYPRANLSEAEAQFSTTPAYQRRTVDGVEAKFQRETGKSVPQPAASQSASQPPKSAKQLKAEAKAEKKEAKRAAKKAEKKQKQAKDVVQMEQAIGGLIG